jgi:hypothetical protein
MVFRQDLLQAMCYTFGCIQSGLTPRQPAEPGQGGFPKGDAATSGNETGRASCQPSSDKPMEGFFMGKVTHHGWSKPGDEIAQPVGIVMGANLRKPEPVLSEAEKVLKSIEEFVANEKKEGR